MQKTIYALATGSLGCAVAIIRISGPLAASIGAAFCGGPLRPRVAEYRLVRDPDDGEPIDQALALFFPGPASFTGEDCLEFQVHGSRAVVTRLLGALGKIEGARLAQPGEFIRRAFDNGKLALSTVEGVADLIDARTDLQRRQALAQAGGRLAARAEEWREILLEAAALIEAELDFADEGDAPAQVLPRVRELVSALRAQVQHVLAEAARGARIREGFRVVIAGPPNAGKSTLLNALAKRDVAIVTSHAGTTRDVIEVELDLNGLPVIVSDTAGIRETEDEVEGLGIQRSQAAASRADLVLWLEPASNRVPSEGFGGGRHLVATKIDLTKSRPEWAQAFVSAETGEGLPELVQTISARASESLGDEPSLVTHERQRQKLGEATRHLDDVLAEDGSELELVAEDLRSAIRSLEALVGRIGTEDVLGAIFSRFCMGK